MYYIYIIVYDSFALSYGAKISVRMYWDDGFVGPQALQLFDSENTMTCA